MVLSFKEMLIFISWIILCVLASKKRSGSSISNVTYDELNILNATCDGEFSCESLRNPGTLEYCSCSKFCSLLGTCCVDSKHKHRYPEPLNNIECEHIFGKKQQYWIPMIKTCNPNLESDETTKELCNSNADNLGDPFLKIPVTDPVTGISYKNYYCFACNENYGKEQPIPWNIELESHFKEVNSSEVLNTHYNGGRRSWVVQVNSSVPDLHYDESRQTWVMKYNQTSSINVKLDASIPEELKNVTPICYELVIPMISECASNWSDYTIEKKCQSYMAVTLIDREDRFLPQYYKNPHCAICNYESINNMICRVELNKYGWAMSESDILFVKLFSLHDKKTSCDDNMVYDYFAKKCRRVFRARKRSS